MKYQIGFSLFKIGTFSSRNGLKMMPNLAAEDEKGSRIATNRNRKMIIVSILVIKIDL
jgi:hypothetical protein